MAKDNALSILFSPDFFFFSFGGWGSGGDGSGVGVGFEGFLVVAVTREAMAGWRLPPRNVFDDGGSDAGFCPSKQKLLQLSQRLKACVLTGGFFV